MHTFMSLNVLVAEKRTEMGKNADVSAGGTTNSIEPLKIVPSKHYKFSKLVSQRTKRKYP